MPNDLVGYSRAGDVFHYRWAARRSLRLIHPNSILKKIVVEGSQEEKKEGEYVIDVSEYATLSDTTHTIAYYQLKHSTVQLDEPFTISDLKETFEGFSKRFLQHQAQNSFKDDKISFTIVTNRAIDSDFKSKIMSLAQNGTTDNRFRTTIEKYTNLTSDNLGLFCSIINFDDGQGDYNSQKSELKLELARLVASPIDNTQIDTLVALVQEKILPNSDGVILKEDVLKRFGITSERELFPAPPAWEKLNVAIKRKQHENLKDKISKSEHPVIVHASGGVGKSVFCRQLVSSLPLGSLGITYDCFGAGRYRNRSEPRHRHRDALVQIVNELSAIGLCEPLLVVNNTLNDDIIRRFLSSIGIAVKSLKETDTNAELFIVIDAADNAEMAAEEFNEPCFAHEVLRETMPVGCKLVMLCRTERISLLQPLSTITLLELESFSEDETSQHLRTVFPTAKGLEVVEFHRLTSGNPRVQSNSLEVKYESLNELLSYLGPIGTTVEKQIELQLKAAVSKIRDSLPKTFQTHVDSICIGLASLPPFIPIDLLAKAANVEKENIRSFISEMGRSLWLTDNAVQFRDEPTETWFRKTFLATKKHLEDYIETIEPIASVSTYAAEILPQLYLQVGQYDKLIQVALSEDYLPQKNPLEARNARVHRLQFAFKAALKTSKYKDALKVSVRAGEEVAGNQRQLDLLGNNIDLVSVLQNREKLQELAFKRVLTGAWDGSSNVYSAALLSAIKEYHGEANSYLRSAINWLLIYYQNTEDEDSHSQNVVSENDILQLANAHLNTGGTSKCMNFLRRFSSKHFILQITQKLVRILIDSGKFDLIEEFLNNSRREPHFTVSIVSELLQVGHFPSIESVETCLDLLCNKACRIAKSTDFFNDYITPTIIRFLEVCLYHNLPSQKILRALRYYVPLIPSQLVQSSHHSNERHIYISALAIRSFFTGESTVNIQKILPKNLVGKVDGYSGNNDIKDFKEVINGLFPWYSLRIKLLAQRHLNFQELVDQANEFSKKARYSRYRSYDKLPYDISSTLTSILISSIHVDPKDIQNVYNHLLEKDKAFTVDNRLELLRAAYRAEHLRIIAQEAEQSAYELLKEYHSEGPDQISSWYISLTRAVIHHSIADASFYFDEAIKIASKFGDEIVQRWQSISTLAQRACKSGPVNDELAYRFIRCAELVGENVYREKNWDREGAIQICTKMSPGLGISALSRWRDRRIGIFEYGLEAVIKQLLTSKSIRPDVGWALVRFDYNNALGAYLNVIWEEESSNTIKQNMLDEAVEILSKEGLDFSGWCKLKDTAEKFNLSNEVLNEIISFHKENDNTPENFSDNSRKQPIQDFSKDQYSDFFTGIQTIENFQVVVELINKLKTVTEKNTHHYRIQDFLIQVLYRIKENFLFEFIDNLMYLDCINYYDVARIIEFIPSEWTNRVGFRKEWPKIVIRYGKIYAHELSNRYSFKTVVERLKLEESLKRNLVEGISLGLSQGSEFADANILFGFTEVASIVITEQDSQELVDFSISRFEVHMEKNFGDGIWDNWLRVSSDINNNIAGFVWSALGAPEAATRWNAVHCILTLANYNCQDVLQELVHWFETNKVGPFGSNKFPFYNLHAQQYFLVALKRIALKHPGLLVKFSEVFSKHALTTNHILIKNLASEIALKIEEAKPGSYSLEIVTALKLQGIRNFKTVEGDYNYSVNSYLHDRNDVDVNLPRSFGLDFDHYWFEPLGRVFGIHEKQIAELAANVLRKELGIVDEMTYNSDPRASLWNRSSSDDRETWYRKVDYPKTDNLIFYTSYHSMLIVAGKLLENMPVVSRGNEYDNEWEDWLSRHLLNCSDESWLVDYRSPLPLSRSKWVGESRSATWQTDITEEDFANCLKVQKNSCLWINVEGNWNERKDYQSENISVSSAIVSKKTSESLLRALSTCDNPHHYKLPGYHEEGMEIEYLDFSLRGWITKHYIETGLDRFDPYANDVHDIILAVGDDIQSTLSSVSSGNVKLSQTDTSLCVRSESWRSYINSSDEEADQEGFRLNASLTFLKELTKALDCELIFEVHISRNFLKIHRDDNDKHSLGQYKIFILSADGKLRSTNTSYQLG